MLGFQLRRVNHDAAQGAGQVDHAALQPRACPGEAVPAAEHAPPFQGQGYDAILKSVESAGCQRVDAEAARLAGLIVTPGYDLQYLIGSRAQTFERLTALVLPVGRAPTIVVPRLELASFTHSVIYLGLLICAFALNKPQPETFILGLAHVALGIFASVGTIWIFETK